MKECEKYAALLDAFSEGDLFMEDMVQVQNHLMNCPHCQAYLENLMAMRAAFPTVEETEVPEGFADRVMAAVAEHPRAAAPVTPAPKAKKSPWRKALLPIAACCAIVVLLGRTAISGGSSKEAAVMAAQSRAETTEECAVAEECAAEEPKAKESTAAGLTADAAEDAVQEPAAYDGAAGTPAEAELVVNDAYSYTADKKTETVTTGGEEYVQVTVTTEETAEAAPEEEEAPILRDGTEFLLTAEEAGDLLAGFTPAAETETEALYLLSARDYIALLTALPREVRQSAPANTAETMRVIVLK